MVHVESWQEKNPFSRYGFGHIGHMAASNLLNGPDRVGAKLLMSWALGWLSANFNATLNADL